MTLKKKFPASRHGYILFEVMLATMIFCLVVISLATALGDTANAITLSNRKSQVRLGLQNLLAQYKVLPVQIGVQDDNPDPTGISYQHEWQQLNLTNSQNQPIPNLYLLIVRASWMQGGQSYSDEASIYVNRAQ